MSNATVATFTNSAARKDNERLNILTFTAHEPYETALCRTGHKFYAITGEPYRQWRDKSRPRPDNYYSLHIYDAKTGVNLPNHVDFDLVLSHTRGLPQYDIAHNVSLKLGIPHIDLEHTLPPGYRHSLVAERQQSHNDIPVFVAAYNREQWMYDRGHVIHHGVEEEYFVPGQQERQRHILSVVNDWKDRDWCCGYRLWEQVTKGLPVHVRGENPGLSTPTASVGELLCEYQTSRIFLNTTTVSSMPVSLIEAMMCGCAIVTTATCMIPEVFENGVDGFISNNPATLRDRLNELLNDEDMATEMGLKAREKAIKMFGIGRFVDEWNTLFEDAAAHVTPGLCQ